ncbi:TY-Chap domain-containing protein [Actinomadura rupiterrae]|uniref:TY-Chap domain-containing protein n=1 Tax=Actinomadura rupiterrae TaxID=559627 RepID=UPI0020A42F07|nr:hypothetical protein [Actinomadura rupiterrae]MCP2342823.1 hypothetical protein [Actinomadura rupiterrae]
MSPTDDQIRELVHRFATLDMTGWDDAAFDRAAAHLGWRPAASVPEWRRSDELYDTGLGTDHGSFARHGSGSEESRISVRVGEGDELFLRMRAALQRRLRKPSVMRGPGPLLRWRGPVRLLELERMSDAAYLTVRPTEPVENDEYRTAKWAEPEDGLGLLGYWQVVGRGPELEGAFFPGGYYADDWDEFEERLARTLESVVGDYGLLEKDGHFTVVVHAPGDRFVQWTTGLDWSLYIEAGKPPGHGGAWVDAMTELGWPMADSARNEPTVGHEFPVVGAEEAATAARMLVGALKSHGVDFEGLWYAPISADPDLLGIGLPTRPNGRV